MKWVYRLVRTLIVTAIILVAVVPAVLYVALSLSGVQQRIAGVAEKELSQLLDAKVTIGSLGIIPFNRVVLRDVAVETQPGDTCLKVQRLGAGVDLWEAVTSDRWRINYVEIIEADARLRRDSLGAPLNISPIINALKPKEKKTPPTRFDLMVATVVIRSCSATYDVADQPRRSSFDPNHLHVSKLRADISLPRLANDDFLIDLRRLAFEEHSGLAIRQLTGKFHISNKELSASQLDIELASSRLKFADINLPVDSLSAIPAALRTGNVDIALQDGCHIWLPDLAPFLPPLQQLRLMADIPRLRIQGNAAEADASLRLELENMLDIDLQASGMRLDSDRRNLRVSRLLLDADGEAIAPQLEKASLLTPRARSIIASLGRVQANISGSATHTSSELSMSLKSKPGAIDAELLGRYSGPHDFAIEGDIATDGPFDLAGLLPGAHIGAVDGAVSGHFTQQGSHRDGVADIAVSSIVFKGNTVSNIHAAATIEGDLAGVQVEIDDPAVALALDGSASLAKAHPAITLNGDITRLMPDRLGLWNKYPGGIMSAKIDIDMNGPMWRAMEGHAAITDFSLKPADSEPFILNKLQLTSENIGDGTSRIELSSDYLDGFVLGDFNIPFLGHNCLEILSEAFPSLLTEHARAKLLAAREKATRANHLAAGDKASRANHGMRATNDFLFDFTVKETELPARFFHLPVSVIYPMKIKGGISQETNDLELNISAPYLRQGSKLIENTSLSAYVDGREDRARLNFVTTLPTKGGPMTMNIEAGGHDDLLRTSLTWNIDRKKVYRGDIRVVTDFRRDENDLLVTSVNLRRSALTFNDSTWTLLPATVTVKGKEITVDGIDASHGNQFIRINGTVSPDPTALLTLDLRRFSLDYLFESLGIDAAMLGGDASGTFIASDLYSPHPRLETPGLRVKDISYNSTVLGDAVVRSKFDPAKMGVMLDADIDNNGRLSTVNGGIFITRDSLDLTFRVDREPVGFLQPYMSAFASDIRGYASGWARVFGNFKYIDLEGDVYADSVAMKINFTNTTYWATDSVHLRPGHINLNGITVHDFNGHSARLNGWVRHQYFKEPRFEFSITGAKDLLCYNETSKENPRWYGRVFGNGGAFVKGKPGVVDISVDMTTAPGSNFTFVLSDQIDAEQYSFLTFRDKGKMMSELSDTIRMRDTSMDLVNRLKELAANHEDESSSDYNITIQMGVTPDARIDLVMDPVGGDRIRAYGTGHIRMDYGSANNELKMFGTYTLDRGDYNFTLQDIILKDFTIKPGSEIAFRGDPYAAQLDIRAAYSLNANLSDLDESFLNDSELNRTNVPVNAIMKVTGDIRQPELAFDLEFPTLTSDIYRKVRSIISTDEMMNRQILYLLALNRFYTPDYMAGATRGNELVSVASSTISSQLGSILGQISDNWNIAPAFRSSRGDFSDMEVDLALSSRLLNNRLLFNGNLGYRDKSLNSNQFVGDFELEYLLNRSGNFRLKAYNRYNDQNYYLRSALTTQGVGIILRKDFDSLTSFLCPLFRRRKQAVTIPLAPQPADSLIVVPTPLPADSIPAKAGAR